MVFKRLLRFTREIAEKVEKLMGSLKTEKYGWMIRDLLEDYYPTPVSTDTLETPEDFLIRCN